MIKSKNKGKSGGGRIITLTGLITIEKREVVLITLYDKGEIESISNQEIMRIIEKSGF